MLRLFVHSVLSRRITPMAHEPTKPETSPRTSKDDPLIASTLSVEEWWAEATSPSHRRNLPQWQKIDWHAS